MDKSVTIDRFRERLRRVIDDSGLTQSAFAERVGIDRSTLSQILSARTARLPRVETLSAIATSEQVSLDWLVGLSETGEARANLVQQSVELSMGGNSPVDERLSTWHAEAKGYKIRHVPLTFPDLVKTAEIIEYEYSQSSATTPEQRIEASNARLAYQREPETDTEVCIPVQRLESFVAGVGIWKDLPADARARQLDAMIELCDELYPRYRWFLFDGLTRFSVPLTVFGPLRAAIYMGHMYLVLSGREHIERLIVHFDQLIRQATIHAPQIPDFLRALRSRLP